MQTRPSFDYTDLSAKVRQFEELLRCAERSQKRQSTPSWDATQEEEALVESVHEIDTPRWEE